jgi:hypothetical protein
MTPCLAQLAYRNARNEVESWHMVDVLAIEELAQPRSGGEVLGFITRYEEFAKWTGQWPGQSLLGFYSDETASQG